MTLIIEELAEELHDDTLYQETPIPLYLHDYCKMIEKAIRRFFRDINSPESFSKDNFEENEEGYTEYNGWDFLADEIDYILILAQIGFFKRVQTDVNNTFGYSTDALTVTNADKPYANLKDTLENLEKERRIAFYKMTRYSFGVV